MYSPRIAAEKIIAALNQIATPLADITIQDLKPLSLDEFLVTAEIIYCGERINPFELLDTIKTNPENFGLKREDTKTAFSRYDLYLSCVPKGYFPALTKAHNPAAHEDVFLERTNLAGALQEILDEESLTERSSPKIAAAMEQLILLNYNIKRKEDSYTEIPEERWFAYFSEKRKRNNQARQKQLEEYSSDIRDLAKEAFEVLIALGKAHRER